MRIFVACPAPAGSTKGNRVTAARWRSLLQSLGHRVAVGDTWAGEPADLLIALHARKSHASLAAWRARRGADPAVVCLAGTDLYVDFPASNAVWESLAWADRIVTLQPLAIERLPAEHRAKARTIVQSATPLGAPPARPARVVRVCVVGHLRAVKDPLRAGLALPSLPSSLPLRIVQVGDALEPHWAREAEALAAREARYRWLGPVSRGRARRILASSHAMVLSSRLEGGANVLGESLVLGTPVLASRIDGNVGLLGPDYPAYYPVGDTAALAALMARFASDVPFARSLRAATRRLAPMFRPAAERDGWRRLLADLDVTRRATRR